MGTRYSTPPSYPGPTTPGTPPPYPHRRHRYTEGSPRQPARLNSAVGLKSVHQLSLCVHFSGFLRFTEVYNLSVAGNPNDHNVIPRTK